MQGRKLTVKDLVFMAVGAVLITVCSWISIPTTVPFTLQTFAVFFVICFLGGKKASISVLVYILMGLVGLPVFSGMTGGLAKLIGTTGGYIIGFIPMALIGWLAEKVLPNRIAFKIASMLVALLICYAFGTAWFMIVYAKQSGAVGLGTALGWCVIPFIIPDIIKMLLALFVATRIKKALR